MEMDIDVDEKVEDTSPCILCNEYIKVTPSGSEQQVIIIKKKALQSLTEISEKLNDDKCIKWSQLSSAYVHAGCRMAYLRQNVTTSRLTPICLNATSTSHIANTPSTSQFDFENNCFFCGEKWDTSTGCLVGRTFVDNKILSMVKTISNQDLKNRLSRVTSLMTINARYHWKCYESTFEPDKNDNHNFQASFDRVCNYLEKNKGKTVHYKELKQEMGTHDFEIRTLVRRLEQKYGHDIYVLHQHGKEPLFFYKRKELYWACNSWMVDDTDLKENEENLVLHVAASILYKKIKTKKYDRDYYNSPNEFLSTVDEDIPPVLSGFLKKLLFSNTDNIPNYSLIKLQSIAHSIISIIHPRSFISHLQLAISTYILRKTGSKLVLNILSKLGISTSYKNTQLFEASAVINSPTLDTGNSFVQFVFDNTDHNVSTMDGHRTFHCMGGISIYTPEQEITFESKIKKLTSMPTETEISKVNVIQDTPVPGNFEGGLSKVIFVDTTNLNFGAVELLPPAYCGYFFAHYFEVNNFPSWKGFEEIISRDDISYHVSRVICLPFIPHIPSNLSTVYTSICHAKKIATEKQQQTCFVTCDQPLYIKGVDLTNGLRNNGTDNVQMVLGLFHLVMSYLGALGYIMSGSGLSELFGVAYAPNTIKNILLGHAFSRAMRAHMLAYTALGKIICDSAVKDEKDKYKEYIDSIFEEWGTDNAPLMGDFKVSDKIQELQKIFLQQLNNFKNNGPTAQLWVQYFESLTILFKFYEASRLGDWNLHLQSIKEMLPLFHASGHYNYAKSAQIYLQDMANLKDTMNAEEYRKYTKESMFTIRRSDKAFSGIWTDMTIEQTLNRFFGTDLVHGRGVTPGVIARYLGAMPTVFPIMNNLEEFCEVDSKSSEQHKDLSPSSIKKDKVIIDNFVTWFKKHKPFTPRDVLISLGTGVVGTEDIDCYKAILKGKAGMATMVGKNAAKISLTGLYKVKNLDAAISTVHHPEVYKSVDSSLLFQRIFECFYTDEALTEEALKFELSPFPLSLFDKSGFMRSADKSKLYDVIEKPPANNNITADFAIVVDGGFLLHQIQWAHGKTLEIVCESYLNYLKAKFKNQYDNKSLYVVFDGYNNEYIGVKSYERYRRKEKNVAADFDIELDTPVNFTQIQFLSNICNKQKFVEMLSTYLRQHVHVENASEDADTLIVDTALKIKKEKSQPVAVVGNDTDLLVLLIAKTPSDEDDVYFQKTVPAKKIKLLYPISIYGQLQPYILFLHAFSGCDTTSSFYNKGKKTFMQLIQKTDPKEIIEVFNNSNSSVGDINMAAERFVRLLFHDNDGDEDDIDKIRYKRFRSSALSSNSSIEARLSSLPPTKAALHQHAQRVYYQVQRWLGNELNPVKWGWSRVRMLLVPLMTTEPPAPEIYLRKINCGCTKKCTGRCVCKKAGLKCSRFCKNCEGIGCGNDCIITDANNSSSDDIVEENMEVDQEESDNEVIPDVTIPDFQETIHSHAEDDDDDDNYAFNF